jgi:hypothetical protein
VNKPRFGFINDPHTQRSTDGEHKRQRLTPQVLARHQNRLSRALADPGLVLADEQAHRAGLEAAARTLDFALPTSATRDYTGMTPVGRYMAERVDGQGPWSAVARRR